AAQTVTVTLRVPLCGADGVVKLTGIVTARRAEKWSFPKSEPFDSAQDKHTPASGPCEGPKPVELVVIDTGATEFQPLMFPRIETSDGRRVFDAGDVPRDELHRRLMASYAIRREVTERVEVQVQRQVILPPRVLFIRADASKGKSNGTIVLSDTELAKLAAHTDAETLIKSGKLLILTPKN
ncbi:MAG: hypothetical protein ACYSTL_06710, partial [Planctomycetota bacterium]